MNYSDFGEIIEDEFTGSVFGKDGQLKVLGKCEKWHHPFGKYAWLYAVQCSVCQKDPELYGDGIFKSIKSSLVKGQIPCGCSLSARRDETYYKIICNRKALELGYKFHGWAEEFSDRKTKLILECPEHGVWKSGIINNFTNRSVGCPDCKAELVGKRFAKSNNSHILEFMATGSFAEGTVFTRSERVDNLGRKAYWQVFCPICRITATAATSSLKQGSKPCECSRSRQKIAYIKEIVRAGVSVALKFGITSNVEQRIKYFKRKTELEIKILDTYVFETVAGCRNAERKCIETLECGIIEKSEMGDGFTETTYVKNLEAIREIYEKFGGKKSGALIYDLGTELE